MIPIAWFKVDDQLAFHPKAATAGNAAMGLWVRAGSYASAHLTDGFIASAIALAMANECDADALVNVGLWDRVDGGYQFHGWDEWQPDAEEERIRREERSEKRRAAGRKGAEARWGKKGTKKSDSSRMASAMANECDRNGKPMPPSPSPSPESSTKTLSTAQRAEFDEWWSHWRKKKAVGDARKAFPAARKLATLEQLIDGADTYFAWVDRNSIADQYVIGPGAWLRQERWEDELTDRTPDRQQHRPDRAVASARGLVQAHHDLFGSDS